LLQAKTITITIQLTQSYISNNQHVKQQKIETKHHFQLALTMENHVGVIKCY